MDLSLIDWLASTEAATPLNASAVADVGASLLRKEPTMPRAVAAECHLRMGALRLLCRSNDLASQHVAHAATMAFDMPAEAQLHVLPRAIGLAKTIAHTSPDTSQLVELVIDHGGETLAAAMATAIEAADKSLTELAVLRAIDHASMSLDVEEAERVRTCLRRWAARVALELETAGEMQLADQASRVASTGA